MPEQSLKDKTVKGVGWSAADAFLGQGVTFIVGLVLARLLSPEEYGLIGIVTIFTTILLGFVDCGFGNALIRKQDANEDDYNTMFLVNMGMSILMYLLLFAGAPLISQFFDRPQLLSLVRITGLLLIIQAFSIVQDTILRKRIDFKTKTKASVISAVCSGIVGIGMAFAGFGVWSLVGQQITRQLVYSACLWFFNRWWPKLKFSIESLHYMWGFGWKLMLSGFLDRLWTQLYQAVVGKFYNPATLGQYTRAEQYASIFSSNITSIVQRVSYPVLSTIQNDKERMVGGYRRIIKITMFVTAVIMISMGAVAEPLIYCLIGPQWHQAATFLPYICLVMVLYPLQAINLNMLQIQGRTDIFLYLEIIKKTLAIGPICMGIFVGIYCMLISSILLGFICFFLNSYYTGKSLGYTSWAQLRDIAPSFLIAILVAVSVYFLKYIPVSYWIILPMQILVGTGVFFFICETTKLPEYIEVKEIVISYISKVSHKK
jgi:O-antigen/teichoic acid export membrane protein